MFKRKKNDPFANGGHTLFDRALEIKGSVRFSGVLDIEGRVIGDVFAEDGAEALVRVRENGSVEGDIYAPKVIVNGTVIGDIFSSKHLELASKALVNGNVHYSIIEMVKGSEVNGSLIHEVDAKEGKDASKPNVETLKVKVKAAQFSTSAVVEPVK
ncbi:MAG: cytoskeletal protein CcmA (bactofilin family) [Lentisphaeria bacterium]|jgi:cytoskeletal protein CcmA (bactofilin family)